MLSNLSHWSSSRMWWGALILLYLALEVAGLYYQYQLNYLPCVLCVHVRMLFALLLLIAIVGWVAAGNRILSILALIATTGVWLWMTERSYQLLATERGWSMGECSMESGLPHWLALEQWFPWIFHIHEPCGYTPYLLFKISMAEALIVMSVAFSLLCLLMLVARFSVAARARI